MKTKFPNYHQPDYKDCGPTCIKIIAKHYNKTISLQQVRQLSETTREGSTLLGLSEAAESIGFRSIGVKLNLNKLSETPLPCILHWNKVHFVVLYKIKNNNYYISDPAHGLLSYTKEEFLKSWIGNNATSQTEEGIALLLEPTPKFYNQEISLPLGEGRDGLSVSRSSSNTFLSTSNFFGNLLLVCFQPVCCNLSFRF